MSILNPVYDMKSETFVELKPYMQYISNILTRYVTPEVWESSLKNSRTADEYEFILEVRKRMAH